MYVCVFTQRRTNYWKFETMLIYNLSNGVFSSSTSQLTTFIALVFCLNLNTRVHLLLIQKIVNPTYCT